ncbi:hypothetical protein BSK62_13095 [Paenibacillus odorifer]|uniref:hypothetical protein n=1 Tax=Paenibacillus odorifer TaxID=189426 RepID=UPI00096DD958|nr:hypothetical protein [Paenibacillus odorifer]OMD65998.1 hypothetical protein BSK62_13095 [Paenibacillus odorifer]
MKETISFRDALLLGYIDITDNSCLVVLNKAINGQMDDLYFEEEASIVFGYIASYLYGGDREKFDALFKPIAEEFKNIVEKERRDGFHEMLRDRNIRIVK